MPSPPDPNESASRWKAIVESAVDGIIVIDARGLIEAFNPAAERLFGYAEADVVGRNVAMLMPSPYREEHDHYIARYVGTGQARIIGTGREVVGLRRDGTTFPLHLSVGEVDTGGEPKFTGIVHDLSARVVLETQLRDSEARWRAVIDSAVDGIIVIDERGSIEAFNPAAERLFGYMEQDVLGKNVNVLMPPPYRHEHDAYLTRYLGTGAAKIIGQGREVAGRRQDGTIFPLHLSVGEMVLHGERKFTGILHDLSARVRMEQQLREQAALAHLGEMAAVVAHEVKNPLAGIRAAIQMIGRKLGPQSGEARVVDDIVGRIDALSELMKDLLLFARPPQPRLTVIDPEPLVASTVQLVASDPSLQHVAVVFEGTSQPVSADPELMKIVFLNVMVNAGQAMNGNGTIRVRLDADHSRCRIAFTDHGPGIPREIRDRLFTPFVTTKARGTGLGLATAKRLVEAHGGQITVESAPEGGTRVVVALPLA